MSTNPPSLCSISNIAVAGIRARRWVPAMHQASIEFCRSAVAPRHPIPPFTTFSSYREHIYLSLSLLRGRIVERDYGKAMCWERDNECTAASYGAKRREIGLLRNGEREYERDKTDGELDRRGWKGWEKGEKGAEKGPFSGRAGPIRLYRLIMQIVRLRDKRRNCYRSPRMLLLRNAAANATIGDRL